ncbi:MAG: hypothetical protein ACTSRK_18955 [Promethearchaeota archaeon]
MSKIGPYNERDLGDKLQSISIEDMQIYHLQRMKKYRIYTIVAFVMAIISSITFFVFVSLRIITGIIAVVGIVVISFTNYERKKWVRLYENLLYQKRRRAKIHKDQDQIKSPHPDKFKKLTKKKK